MGGMRWTDEGKTRLKAAFRRGGMEAVIAEFEGERTEKSLKMAAWGLGLLGGIGFRDASDCDRPDAHRREPDPPDPLNIALTEWGRFTEANGPEQLMPSVGMNIPNLGIEVSYDEAA